MLIIFNIDNMKKIQVKIKKKISKDAKSILIAMLLGDGTICNNNVFKLCHAIEQQEYLEWKIKLLNELGLKNNGLKTYISSCGYNTGSKVVYTQLGIIPTIKALRRTVYKPKKQITRKLLDWLDARGLAIWFMDDGSINVNTSKQRPSIQHTILIATCCDKDTADVMIKYFKEVWNVKMRKFPEGNGYSLSTTSESECKKFVEIVKPYIKEVPSLLYKIRNNFTKQEFIELQARSAEHLDEVII